MRVEGRRSLIAEHDLRQACADLERRLVAGESFSAEALFASHPELTGDADAALEVIYTEFVVREQLGQRPTPGDYRTRFPQWRDGLAQLFQIHGAVGAGSAVIPGDPAGTPFPDAERLRILAEPDGADAPRRIGNHELLREIGRGGMGVVYKARQLGLNRLVALKMILTGADAGPKERARFRTEAEAAARLHHPNIVQIYEVGEHDGRPFLALELVEGGSLEAMLTGTPWPATEAAQLIETLARAIHYAHQQGIVHRDLKPANILLSGARSQASGVRGQQSGNGAGNGRFSLPPASCLLPPVPKIADFGLARKLASASNESQDRTALTAAGAILGTPAYMAPEQAAGDGQQIGPATDVYALGAILYELFTGRPPFQGLSLLETLEQVRTREPVPPGRFLPGLPRDIETICLKCLRKEPGQRYKDAAELADDLGRFQRGEPVHARPTPAWEKTWKWAKRRPAVAALLVSLVLLMIIGLTSVTVLWRQTAAALDTVKSERDEKEAVLGSKLVALAHRDWLANDLDAARQHLAECPLAFRGAEWRYLDRVCHACLFVLGNSPQISDTVSSVAWSPNGQYLAANHAVDPVIVWDPATGRERFTLPGQAHPVTKLAFNPDGHLVSVSWSRSGANGQRNLQVKIWDMDQSREVGALTLPLSVGHGALSTNGRRLVVAGGGKLTLVDVSDPTAVAKMDDPPAAIQSVALNADGRVLACRLDSNTIQIWDTVAKSKVSEVNFGHNLRCFAISPDGSRLAVGGYERVRNTGLTSVFDCRTGQELVVLRGHVNPLSCAEFSPDGRRLATASADKSVMVWDLDTGRELITLRGHFGTIWALAFSPDGTRLASGAGDGAVRIWDVRPSDRRPD